MTGRKNRRFVLAERPVGLPSADAFRLEETDVPEPTDGEIVARTLYLSLDPYMRGRMNDAPSYTPPVAIGGVMDGGTVAEVTASRAPGFAEGDIVVGYGGWQDYVTLKADQARKVDPTIAPISTALGVLGMPGHTAYAGLHEIGKPKAGETLVVAAASGAVGAVVGQIAKIKGCRVVGIAGGEDKCAYVRGELGFDAAVNYRDGNFAERLSEACPDGVDVYWENVGGPVFDAVLPLLNPFARIPVCGLIHWYNVTEIPTIPDPTPKLMRSVLVKRLTIRGFIVFDFNHLQEKFLSEVGAWVQDGKIRYREDIRDGLENAPAALIDLLQGGNFGKMLIRTASG
ncbi:MAG: NADP-dependent oxidoreductase [Alphaproteobacteria bacterium]|nr:NADP-dependent oxidoreductase [Alphaproteobacteria bacterium]